MIKNKSLAFKFILFISGSSILIFLAIIGLNYQLSKTIIMSQIRQNAENVALRTVNKIEADLAAIEKIPQNLAYYLEEGDLTKDRILNILRMVVGNNQEIYGVGVAFEPHAYDPASLYFAPYFAKEKKGLVLDMMGSPDYNYFNEDWYQIPRELNRTVWTEPYFDVIMMSTYSVPFYKSTPEGKKLQGIICTDISLEKLTALVNSVKVLKTGDAYLISKNGTIITHSIKDFIMNETIFTVAQQRNDAHLREIGRKMVRGESGFVPFVSIARNKKAWMYYAPVPSTGWTLAVIFPEDELLADIRRNSLVTAGLGVFGILLLVAVIIILTRSITKPLRLMAEAAHAIGMGDLDVKLPAIMSEDEVGKLTRAFENMKTSLREYIRKLTETTAAKERIESELKIAHEIQTSILPRVFPAFPDRKEFDIFATMEPAKEVGGDFYDFVLIDQKKLYFVMGDVSGKGVPAALFMMITKTLLKNEALQGSSAAQILYKVNNIIAMDNATSMFATVFCGILDTETGEVQVANAGHNPPLVGRAGKGFEFLKSDKGFVLGPMPNFNFKANTIQLAHGDCLFLYTDGVTEAMNHNKELFSEAKLLGTLQQVSASSVTDMVAVLRKEIRGFVKDEPQSDDITMLVFRFN
jgi:phosphoserine phosphatase RsbU/P